MGWRCKNSRRFFTDGVLIPTIVLEIDGTPRLRADEGGKVRCGHDIGLAGFGVLACRSAGQFGEQPHAAERNAGTEARGGFGDKTSAAGAQHTEDFSDDGFAVSNDEKEARDDDCVDGVRGVGEGVGVAVSEGAVLEAAAGGPGFGSGDKAAREIDAGGVDLGILL